MPLLLQEHLNRKISSITPCKTKYAGSVRVLESFGKLWKLIMQFSRTWRVLEKRGFQNGYGKVLEFCFGTPRMS